MTTARVIQCAVCGCDVPHKPGKLKYCLPCSVTVRQARERERNRIQRAARATKPREPRSLKHPSNPNPSIALGPQPARKHTIAAEYIIRATALHYGLTTEQLRGKTRTRRLCRPRWIAMQVIRDLTGRSLPSIGQLFSGRDHASVLHGLARLAQLRAVYAPHMDDAINAVKRRAADLAVYSAMTNLAVASIYRPEMLA